MEHDEGDSTLYKAWEHICADAFDDPEKGIIAVVVARPAVTAYFDESYNHPKKGSTEPLVYTVACYFATRKNWDDFKGEWNEELGKKGLESFHMNEFEFARSQVIAGRPLPEGSPYLGWKREDFDAFLPRLHNVIGRNAPSGLPRLGTFQSEVIRTDFDALRPADLANDPECKSHYVFCMANVMRGIAQWANNNNYFDPIHYIFALNAQEAGNIANWFAYCAKHPPISRFFRIGKGYSVVPYDTHLASDEPALQAADICAYEINKGVVTWAKRGYDIMYLSTMRKALKSLVQGDYFGAVVRKEEMPQVFEEIRQDRRRFPV